ncbi:MAG: cysteine--tRNA ligase [Candidatus Moraniibacteriota bacterium]|nr:MAG: cysteine--tRNA ligase [Candidatus Moranbacteria bacterium]
MLNLYNTLSRKIEPISPNSNDQIIRMYTCGPTVYNYAHIGNLRSFISADLLYRSLKFNGLKVEYVMNITDVDDKTIQGAIAEFGAGATVENLKTYTDKYLELFLNDLKSVNIDAKNIRFIRVSEVIPQIQEFILKLIEKGYAYHSDDGVYFSIEKYQADFKDYGALIGDKFLEGKKIGARVAVDEYEKDNLSDFALWKKHAEADGQIFWDHETLGKGRPGWHIECSVINKVAFGENEIDIHTGGVDLIFPHHTNEIAQSQPLGPFVKHWMHTEHLQVAEEKMAKSKNNFYTLRDLEAKGFSGLDLRYLYLQSHYKTQSNFSWEALESAHTALQKLKNSVNASSDQSSTTNTLSENSNFAQALNSDLNTAKSLASAWEDKENLLAYDQVLGLQLNVQTVVEIPTEVQTLLDERKIARDSKDFAKSDELREQIAQLGFEVKDTGEGQEVIKQ